jgi:uncharacterized C2H2 Zn-finger protein
MNNLTYMKNDKDLILIDLVGDFNECPHCKISFLGKDIYQHFLETYTLDWPYKYAKTKEEILESKKNYPELYKNFPDNLDDYTDIEANALDAANSYGWNKNNLKTFRNHIIGVEIQGAYDGVLFWNCSKCDAYWKRFDWSDFKYLLGENSSV